MLTKGAIPKKRNILSVRELVRDDLEVLREKRAAMPTNRFRDPHHRVARLYAAGLRTFEVQQRCGYSISRLQVLSADPAFQELVASYREKVNEAFVREQDEFYELATSNMIKAETQIAEHLEQAEENGELVPLRSLIALRADSADRLGYGKKQTNLNVNVDFAAQLEKAIKRSGVTIDGVSPHPTPGAARLESPQADEQPHPVPIRRRA